MRNIISFVLPSWTTVPLWMALMRRLCGSGIASFAAMIGPMGADESKPEDVSTIVTDQSKVVGKQVWSHLSSTTTEYCSSALSSR